MARDVVNGHVLVTDRTLKRLTPTEVQQLAFGRRAATVRPAATSSGAANMVKSAELRSIFRHFGRKLARRCQT